MSADMVHCQKLEMCIAREEHNIAECMGKSLLSLLRIMLTSDVLSIEVSVVLHRATEVT